MAQPRVVTESQGDIEIVHLVDSRILDEGSIKEISELLMDRVDVFKPKVIINLDRVDYLSSAVLGKLVALHKKAAENKGALVLCGIKPGILEVFKITKLDKLLTIKDDLDQAVSSFKNKGLFGKLRK